MSGSKVTIALSKVSRDRLSAVLDRNGYTVQGFCASAIEEAVERMLDPSPPPITYAEIAAENSIWLRAMLADLYVDEGEEDAQTHATRITEVIRRSRGWSEMRCGYVPPIRPIGPR